MAIGKQHKEKFYHFQDNSPAESESDVPFSAATEEGGGAAWRANLGAVLLGGEREQLPRESWGPATAQSATESGRCFTESRVVMKGYQALLIDKRK